MTKSRSCRIRDRFQNDCFRYRDSSIRDRLHAGDGTVSGASARILWCTVTAIIAGRPQSL
jgi:hypothetical protein